MNSVFSRSSGRMAAMRRSSSNCKIRRRSLSNVPYDGTDKCKYRIDNCHTLVFLRHGESEWNHSKRFTGWVDVDLTDKGRREAVRAGKLLKAHKFEFDEAHTSVLKRAVRTLWTALHASDHHWIPVRHTWRLNERHYGGLTGLSKTDAELRLGKEMLLQYRRGYDVMPLPMDESHPYWTGNERRYRDLEALMPRGESLQKCKERILPYWYESVVPSIRAGRKVLIAAHNNVIRCMVKHLDKVPVEHLRDIEIPTGVPLVYNINISTLKPVGEKDQHGFSGKFIPLQEIPDDDEYSHQIDPLEVLTLESLRREAKRLGLDLANIRIISEIAAAAKRSVDAQPGDSSEPDSPSTTLNPESLIRDAGLSKDRIASDNGLR